MFWGKETHPKAARPSAKVGVSLSELENPQSHLTARLWEDRWGLS